jgi:hypothetical protein
LFILSKDSGFGRTSCCWPRGRLWIYVKVIYSAFVHIVTETCSQDVQFSDGFLIQEHGDASLSSGFSEGDVVVWLVEPCCTKSVVKFSRTLMHPTQNDKMGMTITAFAPYMYEFSNKTLIFADIQGLNTYPTIWTHSQLLLSGSLTSMNNHDGVVLFDLMLHSVDGYVMEVVHISYH